MWVEASTNPWSNQLISLQFCAHATFLFHSFSYCPYPKYTFRTNLAEVFLIFWGGTHLTQMHFFFLTKMILHILHFQNLWLATRTSLLCSPSSKHSLFKITTTLTPIIFLRLLCSILKVSHTTVLIYKTYYQISAL